MSTTVPEEKMPEKNCKIVDPEEEREIRELLAELEALEAEDDRVTHDLNNTRLRFVRKICDKYEEIRKLIVDECCDSPLDIPAPEPLNKERYIEDIERVVDEKAELTREVELTKRKIRELQHQNELADQTMDVLQQIVRFQFEKETIRTDGEY